MTSSTWAESGEIVELAPVGPCDARSRVYCCRSFRPAAVHHTKIAIAVCTSNSAPAPLHEELV